MRASTKSCARLASSSMSPKKWPHCWVISLRTKIQRASVLGFHRRCRLATDTVSLASSLYFLQGTFEKIQLHSLFGQQSLELTDLLAERGFARVFRQRFIADVNRGPGDRATCTTAADEPPTPPTALRCSRNVSVARLPFDGTRLDTVPFVSLPLAVPFPAKCAIFVCLKIEVQSKV